MRVWSDGFYLMFIVNISLGWFNGLVIDWRCVDIIWILIVVECGEGILDISFSILDIGFSILDIWSCVGVRKWILKVFEIFWLLLGYG